MTNFEAYGEWVIDREAIAELVAEQAWQAMQTFVDDGFMVPFTARRKHIDVLKSPAFHAAVDGAMRQSVAVLDQLEQEQHSR